MYIVLPRYNLRIILIGRNRRLKKRDHIYSIDRVTLYSRTRNNKAKDTPTL